MNARTTATKTRTARAAAKTVDPTTADDDLLSKIMSQHHAATQEALGALPSSKRFMLASVVGVITYATSVWFAIPLVEMAVVSVLSFTGYAFLGYLVYVLGLVAVIIASLVAGVRAYAWVTEFDTARVAQVGAEIRSGAARRVSLVRAWFKPTDTATVH